MEWTAPHKLVLEGEVDLIARKQASPWSNRLVLPQIDATDREKFDIEAKIAKARGTLSLRGRRLEGAVLVEADLRKVDFTAARLRGASLDHSQLQTASLDNAQLQGALLQDAQLQGASLKDVNSQGASLLRANLQGASLVEAQLQSVSL